MPSTLPDVIFPIVTPMPKISGLPVLGALPRLLRQQFGFFTSAQAEHGDAFELHLGTASLAMFCHPTMAEEILITKAKHFNKGGSFWDAARVLLGQGLVVSEGELWRRQRRIIQPQFHAQRLPALTETVSQSLAVELDELERLAERGIVRVDEWTSRTILNVLLASMFGSQMPREQAADLREQLSFALDRFVLGMVTNGMPKWLPTPGRRRYQRALASVDRHIYALIDDRRQRGPGAGDLLDLIYTAVEQETGATMSKRQLRDEVVNLFLAGYETTGAALGWSLWLLAGHPEVMKRLRDEVREQIGDRPPTFADLPRLGYAKQIFQEALRLYPSSFWVPRMAVVETEVAGYPIAAGGLVATSTYCIHRHPEQWSEPDRFDPDRFAPGREAERHRLAWMPFGAGRRVCVGRSLSLLQAQLVLIMLAQRFELSRVHKRVPAPKISTTMTSKRGIYLNVRGTAHRRPAKQING